MAVSHLTGASPLVAAMIALTVAQTLKIFTHYYAEKRWDLKRMVSSGGMPSSHSATVMGLTATIGLANGPGDQLFAVCLVMAIIVMYDAMGVRLQAGRQAEVLNQIIYELPPEHPVSSSTRQPLRDTLGHTPSQVFAGALLGCFVSYICFVSAGRPTMA
mmetsp:Transcript_6845/g.25265  ORF Transcript_6845/g.25265 Transcript_6845/m.25265 type:complete len:159 (+) Transcript_6845:353-829(+)